MKSFCCSTPGCNETAVEYYLEWDKGKGRAKRVHACVSHKNALANAFVFTEMHDTYRVWSQEAIDSDGSLRVKTWKLTGDITAHEAEEMRKNTRAATQEEIDRYEESMHVVAPAVAPEPQVELTRTDRIVAHCDGTGGKAEIRIRPGNTDVRQVWVAGTFVDSWNITNDKKHSPNYTAEALIERINDELAKAASSPPSTEQTATADGHWRWQGDGQDDLASMSDGMEITMRAADLRDLLDNAKIHAQTSDLSEAQRSDRRWGTRLKDMDLRVDRAVAILRGQHGEHAPVLAADLPFLKAAAHAAPVEGIAAVAVGACASLIEALMPVVSGKMRLNSRADAIAGVCLMTAQLVALCDADDYRDEYEYHLKRLHDLYAELPF